MLVAIKFARFLNFVPRLFLEILIRTHLGQDLRFLLKLVAWNIAAKYARPRRSCCGAAPEENGTQNKRASRFSKCSIEAQSAKWLARPLNE